jgi:hypothetical protein
MPIDPVTGALIMGGADFLSGLGEDDGADVARNQFKLMQQRFAEAEPLRAMGIARLQRPLPERPDQSGAFADPSNPFAVTPSAIGFGKGYSNQPPNMQASLRDYRGLALGPYGREAKEEQKKQAEFERRLSPIGKAVRDRGMDPRTIKALGLG